MRIALMQPYFFPYIGYFQLLAETDKFIFYDDVNFIKNGWINRNRLLRNGEPAFFTVPLANASSFAKINEVKVDDKQPWRTKLQQTLLHAYKRAPHYEAVSALFAGVLDTPESSVAAIAKSSVCAIARYLNLPAIMTDTSAAYRNAHMQGVDRVLDICKSEKATQYVNVPGGQGLYNPAQFRAHKIDLQFINTTMALQPYAQFGADFVAGLSVVDVIMFNNVQTVRARLGLPPIAGSV